jgi:hypothetical protein
VRDADGAFECDRDAAGAIGLREAEKLVEVVEHALEFVEQRRGAAVLGGRRQLGRERGLTHVAQRRNAAGARGLLDVAPLLGCPGGRLPDGTARRHARSVVSVSFGRSEKASQRWAPASAARLTRVAGSGSSGRCNLGPKAGTVTLLERFW